MKDYEPFIERIAVGQGQHELMISIAVSLRRIADEMQHDRKERERVLRETGHG